MAEKYIRADLPAHLEEGFELSEESYRACEEGLPMEGMRFDWRGDPEVSVGRRVALTDTNGRVHESVITRQSMKYASGFKRFYPVNQFDAQIYTV